MNKLQLGMCAGLAAALSFPAAAQQAGSIGTPGTGNGAGIASSNRDESESYNRVIGKVGSDPVGIEKRKRTVKPKAVAATSADVVAGAAVRDVNGAALGKIESIDGDSAILVFGSGKIRFPLVGFGKDADGLLINLSTKDFLAAVAAAKATG